MKDEALRALGRRIALLRRARKLSQRDVARLAKVDLSTVSSIERGQGDPKISTIANLARALNVRVADLFSDEPLPEQVAIDELRSQIEEVGAIAREALRLAKARKK